MTNALPGFVALYEIFIIGCAVTMLVMFISHKIEEYNERKENKEPQ